MNEVTQYNQNISHHITNSGGDKHPMSKPTTIKLSSKNNKPTTTTQAKS